MEKIRKKTKRRKWKRWKERANSSTVFKPQKLSPHSLQMKQKK